MCLKRLDLKALFIFSFFKKYSSNTVAECVRVWVSTAVGLEEEIIGCTVQGRARQWIWALQQMCGSDHGHEMMNCAPSCPSTAEMLASKEQMISLNECVFPCCSQGCVTYFERRFWRRSCAGMSLWHISGIIYELLLTSLIFFHFLSSLNESVMPQSWPGSTCGYKKKKKKDFLSPEENLVPPGGKGPLDLYLTWGMLGKVLSLCAVGLAIQS